MRKSRLNWHKQERLIEHFVHGSTARSAADLAGVNFKTGVYYFHRLRERIALQVMWDSHEAFGGRISVDMSCFSGKGKNKRGRGAADKVPVFGLIMLGSRIFTQLISDTTTETEKLVTDRKVVPDGIVFSYCWRCCDVLDLNDFKLHNISHSRLLAQEQNRFCSNKNFWKQARRHMSKFNGVRKEHFELYLKECEWRYNTADAEVQLTQIKLWANQCLNRSV